MIEQAECRKRKRPFGKENIPSVEHAALERRNHVLDVDERILCNSHNAETKTRNKSGNRGGKQ
jgi:hypothetical protein